MCIIACLYLLIAYSGLHAAAEEDFKIYPRPTITDVVVKEPTQRILFTITNEEKFWHWLSGEGRKHDRLALEKANYESFARKSVLPYHSDDQHHQKRDADTGLLVLGSYDRKLFKFQIAKEGAITLMLRGSLPMKHYFSIKKEKIDDVQSYLAERLQDALGDQRVPQIDYCTIKNGYIKLYSKTGNTNYVSWAKLKRAPQLATCFKKAQEIVFKENDINALLYHAPLSLIAGLHIKHHNLKVLASHIAKRLKQVKELRITNGPLAWADVTPLSNLTMLDLSHNVLTKLPQQLSILSALRTLSVHDNKLTKAPYAWPDSLESLDMSNNDLARMPKLCQGSEKLKNINLTNNPCVQNISRFNSLEAYNKHVADQPKKDERETKKAYITAYERRQMKKAKQ